MHLTNIGRFGAVTYFNGCVLNQTAYWELYFFVSNRVDDIKNDIFSTILDKVDIFGFKI